MSYEATVSKSVGNTLAFITEIDTRLQAMGWTLYDDLDLATPPYRIYRSEGEDSAAMPVHVKIKWDDVADVVTIDKFVFWDTVTHAGTTMVGPAASLTLSVDDDSSFYCWIYGNKDIFVLITKIATTYDEMCVMRCQPFYLANGDLQSSVSSGSSVVLQLAAGEADNFIVGDSYPILGSGQSEGQELVTVEAVDTGTHQVTVDSLTRGLSANSRIGYHNFPWTHGDLTYLNGWYCIPWDFSGTGNASYGFDSGSSGLLNKAATSPSDMTGYFDLKPTSIQDGGQLFGWISGPMYKFDVYSVYSSEHTISVQDITTGTATSGSSTTLVDSGASWGVNAHQNKCVIITAGTSVGEMRLISSNTSDTLTVPAWTVDVDATSVYTICEKGYRWFYFRSLNNAMALLEVGTV